MKMNLKKIQATLWFTNEQNQSTAITRVFENRTHMLNVAKIYEHDWKVKFDRYHIERVIDLSILQDDDDEAEEPEDCEYCNGTGEIGPFGYEYPEYDDCGHCRGTGKEMPEDDPDRKYDTKKELL